MDRAVASIRRWALLAGIALMLAVVASAADAIVGYRIGSQAIAWLLGAVLALDGGRRVVALMLPAAR